MPVDRKSYSFVCVPTEDPKVPASVIELARAATRDGTAETLSVNYSNFHYELEKVPSVGYDLWAIQRWSNPGPFVSLAEQARGTDGNQGAAPDHCPMPPGAGGAAPADV